MKFYNIVKDGGECIEGLFSKSFTTFCRQSIMSINPTQFKESFFNKALASVLTEGYFPLPSPFSEAEVFGFWSFNFQGGRNVIVLFDNEKPILIVQKYYLVDQVFLPEDGVVIKLGLVFEDEELLFEKLQVCFNTIREEKRIKIESQEPSQEVTLDVSTDRPWHAMYPILGSLHKILSVTDVASLENIKLYASDSYFFDYTRVFPSTLLVHDRGKLNVRVENWIYSLGDQSLDSRVVEATSNENFGSEIEQKILDAQINGSPIIWIDLNKEKRSLVNRNDFLKKFLSSIVSIFSDALFIFDGLTGKSSSTTDKYPPFPQDSKELGDLIMFLGESPNHIHISGFCTAKKLRIANEVNFFVSDAGTASMYVDRFCKKNGVIYKPNKWGAYEHIHYNSSIIHEAHINDVESNSMGFNTSYEISTTYLASICMERFLSDFID
jgi:hypothetical protein